VVLPDDDAGVVEGAGCASPVIFSFIFFFNPPNCALDVAGAISATATASSVRLMRELPDIFPSIMPELRAGGAEAPPASVGQNLFFPVLLAR
jgi:hypothetical protein